MKVIVNLSFDLDKPMTVADKKQLKMYIKECVTSGLEASNYKAKNVKVRDLHNVISVDAARILGGKNRAKSLTSEERTLIATNAARARWAKN